jgi:hypothetical protein
MKALIVLATPLLVGCVSPEYAEYVYDLGRRPVTCASPEECQKKWSAAISWLRANSTYAILTESDTLVTTSPGQLYSGHTVRSGYMVQRIPIGEGAYRIELSRICAAYSCVPSLLEARASLWAAVDEAS